MPIDAGHDLSTAGRGVSSEQQASELAASIFGIHGRAKRLDGEYDDNFYIVAGGREWIFKISHAGEDEAMIAAQHEAIRRGGFGQPRLAIAEVDGVRRHVRLLEWIPGELLAHVRPQSATLLRSLGAALAKLDRALLGFDHPAAHRHMQWDLLQTAELRDEAHFIGDEGRRTLVTKLLQRVDEEVLR